MSKRVEAGKGFVVRYLGRPWVTADGLPEKDVKKAEARLGIALPSAMRRFYLSAGAVEDLCSIHNVIFRPKDLYLEDNFLWFMDENQSVVSWGIKKKDVRKADPQVWQHNNSAEKWYSEKKSFTQLLISMFDWYEQLGVWKPRKLAG